MKTALVTGAGSFLGREVADRLLLDGVDVHAIARPDSDLSRLDELNKRPTLHVHDGSDASMQSLVGDVSPDAVFHFAGYYVRDHTPDTVSDVVRDNLSFGVQVLDAAARAGCRAFINTGSYFQFMDGDAPRAVNLYAAAKNAFDGFLRYYREAFSMTAATLVVFDTYGPRDWRARLMAAIRDAQRNGTVLPVPDTDPEMDFVHSDDIVAAYCLVADLLAHDPSGVDGKTFALRSGAPLRISDIVRVFEGVGGAAIKTKSGGWPAPERAVAKLWQGPLVPGWTPKISLADGIRGLLEDT